MFGRLDRHGERGQLLPLLAIGLVALLGMVALGVDVGFWRYQQRLTQTAADSAAIAGATRLYYPVTTPTSGTAPVEVTAAAQRDATSNGFTDDAGVGKVTVTVNSPPLISTATYPSNTAVEVIVKKKQPVFFARIFSNTGPVVSARAVAVQILKTSDTCIYQLDTAGELQMVHPGSTVAVNCSISVNGAIPAGTITANALYYSGTPPAATLTPPLVAQYALPGTDPCIAIAGCAYLQRTAFPPAGSAVNASGSTTLNPGVYKNCCANITTLNPGVYYMYGGITSGFMTGTGVTIVNVDGAVNFNGHDGMSITAPTTGPTAGIAFYQPPSNTNEYKGNGKPGNFDGLFYAPTATYRSDGAGDQFSNIIVGSVDMTGNNTLLVQPTGNASQQKATHVVLAE